MNNLFEKGLFFGPIKVLSSGGGETQVVAENETTSLKGIRVDLPEEGEWISVRVDKHDAEGAEIYVEGQIHRQMPGGTPHYDSIHYYGTLGKGGNLDFGIPGTSLSVIHEAR